MSTQDVEEPRVNGFEVHLLGTMNRDQARLLALAIAGCHNDILEVRPTFTIQSYYRKPPPGDEAPGSSTRSMR